jgi:hypothetical protein
MSERNSIVRYLTLMEQELKELVVRYEQYFCGAEKREPMKDREDFEKRIRALANRQIVQTDLRFKFQSISARFHTYAGHWDRNLRLMEEGKLCRRPPRPETMPTQKTSGKKEKPAPEAVALHGELIAAHRACRAEDKAPDLNQVSDFLAQQKDRIREKFGDREVEFRVVTEKGKPKIRVRAKNSEG